MDSLKKQQIRKNTTKKDFKPATGLSRFSFWKKDDPDKQQRLGLASRDKKRESMQGISGGKPASSDVKALYKPHLISKKHHCNVT